MSVAALTLRPEGPSAGNARRFVVNELVRADVAGDLVDTAELLVSELVTNAMLHAHTQIVVRVRLTDRVLVEVQDDAPGSPIHRVHDLESVTGRGLELVDLLATAHGVRPTGGGKVVWFALGMAMTAEEGTPELPSDEPAHREILLLNVPAVLFLVVQEHTESLLREYVLHQLQDPGGVGPNPLDVSTADAAWNRIAGAVADGIGAGDPPASGRADVDVPVHPDDPAAMRTLLEAYAQASKLAVAGVLLTRPALPEIRALRRWLAQEVIEQSAGREPRPWIDDAEDVEGPDGVVTPNSYDKGWLATTPAAVIVGDASNRIVAVSPAAAELLGWAPEELVGRRLTAIIPPEFRHAHLAGFTRQLATARPHLLGKTLQLAAWHHDNYELPIRLVLERHAGGHGPIFTGHFTHAE